MVEQTMQIEALSRAAVTALSERIGEPEWMQERRAEAWQLYLDTPFPDSSNDEPWRRTPLRRLTRRLPKLEHASYASVTAELDELPDRFSTAIHKGEGSRQQHLLFTNQHVLTFSVVFELRLVSSISPSELSNHVEPDIVSCSRIF